MASIYLDYVNGDDDNPGTEAEPVKNVSAALALLAAGDTLYIDTTDGPCYADVELIANAFDVRGIGTLTVEGVGTALADVRPNKLIVGTWTRPDADNYPNVWQISDTETNAVLGENVAWATNPVPVKPYLQVTGANYAAVVAGLQATACTYWTNGTTMYCHATANADPNTLAMVRTMPATHATGIRTTNGGNIYDLAVGFAAIVNTAGVVQDGGVPIWLTPKRNGSTSATRCYAYLGGYHTWEICGDAQGVNNSTVTMTNCRWEQGIGPYIWVAYTVSTAGTNTLNMVDCRNDKELAVGGSTAGGNSYTYGSTGGHGAVGVWSVNIMGGKYHWLAFNEATEIWPLAVNATGAEVVFGALMRCSSTWIRCKFGAFPPSSLENTDVTVLRHCLLVAASDVPYEDTAWTNVQGSLYDVQYCTCDFRQGEINAANRALYWDAKNAAPHFTFKNNAILAHSIEDAAQPNDFTVIGGLSATTNLVMDFNVYCHRDLYLGYIDVSWPIWMNGAGAGVSFAAQQTAGFETHSTQLRCTAGTDGAPTLKVHGTTYYPAADSPVLGAAESMENAIDYTGWTWPTRNTAGAMQLDTDCPTFVSAQVDPSRLTITSTWTDAYGLEQETITGLHTLVGGDLVTDGVSVATSATTVVTTFATPIPFGREVKLWGVDCSLADTKGNTGVDGQYLVSSPGSVPDAGAQSSLSELADYGFDRVG